MSKKHMDQTRFDLSFRERMFLGHCIEEWWRQMGTSDQEQFQRDLFKLLTGLQPPNFGKPVDKTRTK